MSEIVSDEPFTSRFSAEEKQWGMFAHLSPLVAVWLGGMAFLGPLIVWLIKRNQMTFVDDQGKEALNFQLNLLIAAIGLALFGFATLGLGFFISMPLGLGLAAYGIIMPVIAAMKANAGEIYRYPFIIRMIT